MSEKPEFLKLLHSEVQYQHPSRSRDKDGKLERCRDCTHFIPDGHSENNEKFAPRCEGVRSPIRPGDWCERFNKKRGVLVMKRLATKGE